MVVTTCDIWKQRLGSSVTYSNLIGVFERAGYQGYADTVRSILGMCMHNRLLPQLFVMNSGVLLQWNQQLTFNLQPQRGHVQVSHLVMLNITLWI